VNYSEPVAATHFSFLRGSSSPDDMLLAALALGMGGIGIADRNSVAGVVRAHAALRDAREGGVPGAEDFKLIVGARLCFADGTPDIAAYPATRRGWGQLTRLLTTGNRRAVKGDCILTLADVVALSALRHCAEPEATKQSPAISLAYDRGLEIASPTARNDEVDLQFILLPDPAHMPDRGDAEALTALAAGAMRGGWRRCRTWRRAQACRSSPPTTRCSPAPPRGRCTM
jgi:PHP domain